MREMQKISIQNSVEIFEVEQLNYMVLTKGKRERERGKNEREKARETKRKMKRVKGR